MPTPAELVQALDALGPSRRPRALRCHKFWREHKIRRGLDAVVATVNDAYLDFAQAELSLSFYARRKEDYARHVTHTVRNPAQKELLAFAAAVQGFHDTLREHLMPARKDVAGPLRNVCNTLTGNDVYEFVRCLRNNLAHGQTCVPSAVVVRSGGATSGAIIFDREDLLAFGNWTKRAQKYVQNLPGEGIVVAETMSACSQLVSDVYDVVRRILREHPTAAEDDFHAIQDGYRRRGGAMSLQLLLSATTEDTDPYAHLYRFFDAPELREIMRRPANSREQVDFIIALKSPDVECDLHLRHKLYKLFGVSDVPPEPAAQPIRAFPAFQHPPKAQ